MLSMRSVYITSVFSKLIRLYQPETASESGRKRVARIWKGGGSFSVSADRRISVCDPNCPAGSGGAL